MHATVISSQNNSSEVDVEIGSNTTQGEMWGRSAPEKNNTPDYV